MAQKSIQIADKPTLDATKALLEDSGVGLAAIKEAVSSGAASGSAGGLHIGKVVDEQVNGCISASTLPYSFYNGSAVVLNDEIHILGGNGNNTNHYKFNGSSWEEVSTLPYNFYDGSAVVLNNEIHILGGSSSSTYKYHYKYNGSSWVRVSTLPHDFYRGSAVVYNGEIHILGDYSDGRKHYKYNGTSWEEVSNLPYTFYDGTAVVYNNEIHIMGSKYSGKYYNSDETYNYFTEHYKYNGTYWSRVSTLPYDFYDGSAVVLNNEIHILGGSDSGNYTKHYKYNGTYWSRVSTLPYNFYNGSAVVYNGEIHILGSSSKDTNHYIIKLDNRHIATMLPKGTHIMLSDNEDINYTINATRISSNIAEVTETGYVELLAALTELDSIKGYLTFY